MNLLSNTQKIVQGLYKDDYGEPFILTEGQDEIFKSIFYRTHPRIHCISCTQYGKSETVALAVLTRCLMNAEKWAIVAPSEKKASIIMGKIIQHVFDNDLSKSKLQVDKNESLDRLRREKSKSRLTFKVGDRVSEIFILSADAKSQQNPLDALMGFGSPNIILDESSLIDDLKYAGIKRMLGGHQDNFLFEIGNPFRLNHFYRTSKDESYDHVFIDYQQALKEGRYTESFINEMRKEPMFDVLYECKFPPIDYIDDKGWSSLFSIDEFKNYQRLVEKYGIPVLGVDVGHGKDSNVWVARWSNYASVLREDHDNNLMNVVGRTLYYIDELKIHPENVFIDGTGIGGGVVDRLWEQDVMVNNVIVGSSAENSDQYMNKRAEYSWRMRQWLRDGGYLQPKQGWEEILDLRFKVQSDRKIIMMSKEEMRSVGIKSPNVADALMLTFGAGEFPAQKFETDSSKELKEYRASQKDSDSLSLLGI